MFDGSELGASARGRVERDGVSGFLREEDLAIAAVVEGERGAGRAAMSIAALGMDELALADDAREKKFDVRTAYERDRRNLSNYCHQNSFFDHTRPSRPE